jgi:hypothetical protein
LVGYAMERCVDRPLSMGRRRLYFGSLALKVSFLRAR